MYHTSAKLTFGGGEIFFWGYKKLQGGVPKTYKGRKKSTRKTEKKVATFFLFFFGDSKIFVLCRGAKNSAGGRRMVNMVNVTPLQ